MLLQLLWVGGSCNFAAFLVFGRLEPVLKSQQMLIVRYLINMGKRDVNVKRILFILDTQ